MPALDVGGEETATVFCSEVRIRAVRQVCLTPVCRQPDGIPTLDSVGIKTGNLLAASRFGLNPKYWLLAYLLATSAGPRPHKYTFSDGQRAV